MIQHPQPRVWSVVDSQKTSELLEISDYLNAMPDHTVRTKVLALHAHPDDEALWSGLALAHWAEQGAEVTVVTATLGEQGEVIGEVLQGLTSEQDDTLGGFRWWELAHSLEALGVNKLRGLPALPHRPALLGKVGMWQDSGMVGSSTTQHSFVNSGLQGVEQLVSIITELRPDIIVTYNSQGGYSHPDHIQCYTLVQESIQKLRVSKPEALPELVLWCETEQSRVEEALSAVESVPEPWRLPEQGEISMDDAAQLRITPGYTIAQRKRDAMIHHATQLWVSGSPHPIDGRSIQPVYKSGVEQVNEAPAGTVGMFVLSNMIAQPLLDTEGYSVGFWKKGITRQGVKGENTE